MILFRKKMQKKSELNPIKKELNYNKNCTSNKKIYCCIFKLKKINKSKSKFINFINTNIFITIFVITS